MKGSFATTLYVGDARALEDPGCFESALSCISEERRAKAESYRFASDQRLSVAASLLWRRALIDHGIDPLSEITYCEKGKPVLKSGAVCLNLSHSNNLAVAAISSASVGVDIERVRPVSSRVAERFFAEEELSCLNALSDQERTDLFFRLWTLKEAFLKECGKGLSLPLSSVAFDLQNGICLIKGSATPLFFHEYFVCEGYRCSVCAKSDDFAPDPIFVDLQGECVRC
ncbi:MAG: 4'-phosphopantetheinyl transferase family protein [Christensenellaceae bacterium]